MSWPEIDIVVGRAVTDHDLRRLRDAAAAGASALAEAAISGAAVEVRGFADAQETAPTFQERAHWCWAACLQAVLRHYGVARTQEEIVSQVYGMAVDLPEIHAAQLYHVLNARIPLPDGTTCVTRGRAFPGDALTPAVLHNELSSNHPVLAVHRTGEGTGHAVVIYGATFGPRGIVSVKYFDPMPGKGLCQIVGTPTDGSVVRWFAIRGRSR
jgi:hypothetical protein